MSKGCFQNGFWVEIQTILRFHQPYQSIQQPHNSIIEPSGILQSVYIKGQQLQNYLTSVQKKVKYTYADGGGSLLIMSSIIAIAYGPN